MVTKLNPKPILPCAALILLFTTAAPAQPAPSSAPAPSSSPSAPTPPAPSLHHTPRSATSSSVPLALDIDFTHPESLRQAILLHRGSRETAYKETPFRRGSRYYGAVIPAADVGEGGIAYAIELELEDGRRIPGFASREDPFDVQVQLGKDDAAEKAAELRLDQRRSIASLSGEWISFGKDRRRTTEPAAAPLVNDQFYRVEASYAYRPLRLVNEFGARLGFVRGTSPQGITAEHDEVGLNYAAPWLQLRLFDRTAYLTAHLVTGVTEVDFSLGGGLALTLGDPYAAHLALGVESIQGFGTRFFTRVNILASDRISLTPIVEATNMPNAGDFGVRLLLELGVQLTPTIRLGAQGGYQARNAVSGAPSFGTTASFAF